MFESEQQPLSSQRSQTGKFFLSDSLLGFGIPFPRILYCFLKLMDSSIYGRGFVRIQDFWWTMMSPEVLQRI